MNMQDPTGLVKVGRPGKILMVENHLSVLSDDELENATPYSIHSNFSVFKMKHLEAGKCVSANIPPKRLADIEAKTNIANNLIMKYRLKPKKSGETSDCYTLKFKFGSFKDKTPAQVLLDNPSNKEKIIEERKVLENNLSNQKFAAANKQMINAINDAISKLEAGTLSSSSAGTTSNDAFFIYCEDCKIPNIRKLVEKHGKQVTYVYSIKVYCNPEMDNPIIVEMMNCWAPVNKNEIVMNEAVDTERSKFFLTEMEWNQILKEMIQCESMFKMFNYKQIDTKVNTHLKEVMARLKQQ